jgi:hypothetical protein
MKKLLLLMLLFLTIQSSKAQDGYQYFFLKAGVAFNNGINISTGIDFSDRYYSAYELSANYLSTKKDSKEYKSYLFGAHYKMPLFRDKNSLIKLKVGFFAGSGSDNFTIAPNFGFEYLYSLTNDFDFVINNNNGYYFYSDQKWISTINVGFRTTF